MNKFLNLSFYFILLFIFSSSFAEAALPDGKHGWFSPVSAIVGDDNICGADDMQVDLEILEYGTNNPVTVQGAYFSNYNKVTRAITDSSSGTGPLLNSICFNPTTQGLSFDILGGARYYDMGASFTWANPDIVDRGKHYRQTVWLTPTPTAPRFTQVSPVGSIVNVNPSYRLSLLSFPDNYGATGIGSMSFFLRSFSFVGGLGSTVNARSVPLSGGVGIKDISPVPGLADGMYTWGGYLHLNGYSESTHGTSTIASYDVSKSGFLEFDWPFMLDSTAPTIGVEGSHVPVNPALNDSVTLTAEASDSLSGITQIKIYVDGIESNVCTFASVMDAMCEFDFEPLDNFGTVNYYFTATDQAGNTATSSLGSFEIDSTPLPPPPPPPPIGAPLSCAVPESILVSSAPAVSAPQALKLVGQYAYVGASGVDAGKGLYIYDISDPGNVNQLSFFSTHSPASVQNNSWGNGVLGLDVEGSFAYLATYFGGLVIVDISNPNAPTFVGKLKLFDIYSPEPRRESWAVEVVGDYAFMSAGKGLIVVDISDKANPVVSQNIDLGAEQAQDITIQGNYAYVAMRGEGFAILDISNPAAVVTVSTRNDIYNASNLAYAVAVKGNYLYVANHLAGGINIYDISNKSNPFLMSSETYPGLTEMRGLYIQDNVLFVGVGLSGVMVLDLSNPIGPTILYRVASPTILSSAKIWDVAPLFGDGFRNIVMVSEDPEAGIYVLETTCDEINVPDLVATSTILSTTSVAIGQLINFSTGDIMNIGNAIAPSYSLEGFFIDSNNDGIAEYEAIIGSQLASTSVGSSTRVSLSWLVPDSAPIGTYRIGYIVNDPESFDELSFDNNWSGWVSFEVTEQISMTSRVSELWASPNPIVAGGSTVLSWTVYGDTTWCWLDGVGGGWQDSTNGPKNISVTPAANEIYTIQCGNESTESNISPREVIVNLPPAVTLTPLGCYIAASSSSCLGTVDWQFIGGTAPYSVRNTTTGELYGTTESEISVPALLQHGTNIIVASDALGLSNSQLVSGICDNSQTTWDDANNTCTVNPPLPTVVVTTDYTLVSTGTLAPLSIEVTSSELLNCSILNAQGSSIDFNHDPAMGSAQFYNSFTTRPLTSAQVVTVNCAVAAFPSVIGTGQIRINVVGIMEEV
jgi:hypothetical protein